MFAIEIAYVILFLSLSVITIYSDVKEGLIRNRILFIYTIVAVIIDIINYCHFSKELVFFFGGNFFIVCAISLGLFYTHSFAGGDCKLLIVLALLYPAHRYLIFEDSALTLVFVIGIAIILGYVYLLYASLIKIVRRETKVTWIYVKGYILNFLRSFLTVMVYICAINLIVMILGSQGVHIYYGLVRIFCLGIAWMIGKKVIFRKKQFILIAVVIDIICSIYLHIIPFSLNPENYILIIVLLLCQMTIKPNLYDEISIVNLKKGMILSTGSSLMLQGSRVRGLPQISVEDLRNRLTQEEVESIMRWGKSKKIDTIVIVRKIPFAMFIVLGYVIYFVWGL